MERQVRRDPSSSEISERLLNKPTKTAKPKKNENHEQVREDPYYSDIPEWLQDVRENLVDDTVPERRDTHASTSHELSLEPTRSVELGKHSVYTHFPKARAVRGPKSQGPRAEDVWAESYLLQKILVI